METAKTSPEKPSSESGSGSGLDRMRFNSTANEDTTVEVLKPQRDPGATRKILTVVAMIVAAFAILGFLNFQRNGLTIGEVFNGRSESGFGAPGEHPVDHSDQ